MSAPVFYTRKEAAAVLRVSEDTIRRAIHSGRLVAKMTGENGGGKTLISADALREFFDSLEDAL